MISEDEINLTDVINMTINIKLINLINSNASQSVRVENHKALLNFPCTSLQS